MKVCFHSLFLCFHLLFCLFCFFLEWQRLYNNKFNIQDGTRSSSHNHSIYAFTHQKMTNKKKLGRAQPVFCYFFFFNKTRFGCIFFIWNQKAFDIHLINFKRYIIEISFFFLYSHISSFSYEKTSSFRLVFPAPTHHIRWLENIDDQILGRHYNQDSRSAAQ